MKIIQKIAHCKEFENFEDQVDINLYSLKYEKLTYFLNQDLRLMKARNIW